MHINCVVVFSVLENVISWSWVACVFLHQIRRKSPLNGPKILETITLSYSMAIFNLHFDEQDFSKSGLFRGHFVAKTDNTEPRFDVEMIT